MIRRLWALAALPRRRVALSVGLGSLAVLFGAGLLASAGYLISRAAEHPPVLALTTAIVTVRFFGLSRPIVRYLDRLAAHDLALRGLGRIRAGIYARLEPLAPAGLASYRRGDLVTRMVGDVDALQGLYVRGLEPPLVALAAGACCVAFASVLLPAAGLILAAGLVAGGVFVPLLAVRLGRAAGRRQAAARGELTAELVELLRGAPELAVYGREEDALARIREADRELARLTRRDALVAGLADGLSVLVTGLTVAAVLAAAIAGGIDHVWIATLALLALGSFEAVTPLPGAARELAATLAAGRRVLEITDAEPPVRDPERAVAVPDGAVAIEGVTARYAPGEQAALEAVDLRLEPGRKVALVGPSGAGKSTVTNLLLRFLDPEQGRVTIGGRDVRECRQDDVRRTYALAGQDAHLFGSTIRENLLLGRPGATDADLTDALRRARIPELGLDTPAGEEGGELSGGERQRVVLARALLRDAPVLILDEPTAHLDPPTAQALMDDVLDETGDRTVLLITHRPEGLDRMDEIVTLDAGRVVATTRAR